MSRRWNPSFVNDYAKLRNRIDRDYGERAYNDKFKIESSPGMLRKEEPDYNVHFKQYQPDNTEHKALSLETPDTPAERSELSKTEPIESINSEPNPYESQLASMDTELVKPKKKDGPERLEAGSGWV